MHRVGTTQSWGRVANQVEFDQRREAFVHVTWTRPKDYLRGDSMTYHVTFVQRVTVAVQAHSPEEAALKVRDEGSGFIILSVGRDIEEVVDALTGGT